MSRTSLPSTGRNAGFLPIHLGASTDSNALKRTLPFGPAGPTSAKPCRSKMALGIQNGSQQVTTTPFLPNRRASTRQAWINLEPITVGYLERSVDIVTDLGKNISACIPHVLNSHVNGNSRAIRRRWWYSYGSNISRDQQTTPLAYLAFQLSRL